ncbi:hypothetical protein M752DRAFT_152804 [Aspergillus phoenicis ATCC 13157]|uniref:Uncharacterized protein n=1 Tax=Aspergillus phoenicis ATCC 13157 TaxID=1353007 RepID=A0A370PPN4_ASPPH|nr:hypothetical protein M752DRAFT_152804 [Aspergillus phoenicis ATCC 13157]
MLQTSLTVANKSACISQPMLRPIATGISPALANASAPPYSNLSQQKIKPNSDQRPMLIPDNKSSAAPQGKGQVTGWKQTQGKKGGREERKYSRSWKKKDMRKKKGLLRIIPICNRVTETQEKEVNHQEPNPSWYLSRKSHAEQKRKSNNIGPTP